jgi:hypothetical protein
MEIGFLGHTLVYLSLFAVALLLLYMIKSVINGNRDPPETNSTLSQNIVIHKVENSCADQGLDITLAYAQSFFIAHPEDYDTSPKKVNYVANQLEGHLRKWFAEVVQKEPDILLDYETFIKRLKKAGGSSINEIELRQKLQGLKQGANNVATYISDFKAISDLLDTSEGELCFWFLEGLSPQFRLFLSHHILPNEIDLLFKEVLIWEPKFNSITLALQHSPGLNYLNTGLSSQNKTPIPQRRPVTCYRCGKPNHIAPHCRTDLSLQENSSLPPPATENKAVPSYFYVFSSVHYPGVCYNRNQTLLDTGAQANFMSLNLAKKLKLSLLKHPGGRVANGNHLPMRVSLGVKFSLGKQLYMSDFYVVDGLTFPIILGFPWWYSSKACLDYNTNCLIHNGVSTQAYFLNHHPEPRVLSLTVCNPEVPDCLADFMEVFDEGLCSKLPPHRSCDIRINLLPETTPPWGKVIPLSHEQNKILKEYLDDQLQKGFMRKSTSCCSSPIFFVKKSDGSLRPCVDYRGLNSVTVKDRYPVPSAESLTDKLVGAKIYSKVDLRSAFNQLRVAKGDEWKTAVRTPFGLYEYLVMPFGLSNAPSSFQGFINEVLFKYIDEFVVIYLDDILIYSKDISSHKIHLQKVFEQLLNNSLYVKASKCEFFKEEIEFLGYKVTKDGFALAPSKLSAIKEWQRPTSRKHLRGFLGLANFCRKFVPKYSSIVAPLTDLTSEKIPYKWNDKAQEAFDKVKLLFCEAPILKMPDPEKPYFLQTDASDVGLGGVLLQEYNCIKHPLAYYSQKFSAAERNYNVHDKELLAIIASLKHWRRFLEGTHVPITILSDHKNLLYFTNSNKRTQRHSRWELELANYNFMIKYITGKENYLPDALSRKEDFYEKDTVYEENKFKPLLDNKIFINQVMSYALNSSLYNQILELQPSTNEWVQAKKNNNYFHGIAIQEETLWHKNLIYVPESLRGSLLYEFHDTQAGGHNGVRKTLALIRSTYSWPGITRFVKEYIKACQVCAVSKPLKKKPQGLLMPLSIPEGPWKSLTMDFITDLPLVKDFDSVLVIVDRFTKFTIIVPCSKKCTATALGDLFLKNVVCLFGTPNEIISDRGPQFIAKFWKRISELLGIRIALSSGHHPETNGQTERMNQTLEQYLRCFINKSQDNWLELLAYAQFNINNTINATTKLSPNMALMGFQPTFHPKQILENRMPDAETRIETIQKLQEDLKACMKDAIRSYTTQANRKRRPGDSFKAGDSVYLNTRYLPINVGCKKLNKKYVGPFIINEVLSRAAVKLILPRTWKTHNTFHVSEIIKKTEPLFSHQDVIKCTIENLKEFSRYEVESILKHERRSGKLFFLVKWVGYSEHETTWEPLENLDDCPEILESYCKKEGIWGEKGKLVSGSYPVFM